MCKHLTLLSTQTAFTIDFICADIDNPFDVAGHATCFQQHVRAIGIVHGKCQTVAKGVVDVSLQTQAQFMQGDPAQEMLGNLSK